MTVSRHIADAFTSPQPETGLLHCMLRRIFKSLSLVRYFILICQLGQPLLFTVYLAHQVNGIWFTRSVTKEVVGSFEHTRMNYTHMAAACLVRRARSKECCIRTYFTAPLAPLASRNANCTLCIIGHRFPKAGLRNQLRSLCKSMTSVGGVSTCNYCDYWQGVRWLYYLRYHTSNFWLS